ncbi:MAG: hypothetical protein HY508_02950 [Acidobacteria bacterium]|nr:hypothetical protein [Acidobacteriota bacterium]
MAEGNATEPFTQYFQGRNLSSFTKVESRWRREERKSPAIEDDAGDVASCDKPAASEQPLQVRDHLALEIGISRRRYDRAARVRITARSNMEPESRWS